MGQTRKSLLQLAHDLGKGEHSLAILGEGNVSVRLSPDQLAVKASGSCLKTLRDEEITLCDSRTVLSLLDLKTASDQQIEERLLESRVDTKERKPSVEAVFHAWLLTLENIHFVGHCHPTAANQVLCSPRARDFAERRLFPDEVVVCGPSSVFVPYSDPGLPLAREIRDRTNHYIQQHKTAPRLICLQNHGLIAIGATTESVLACMLMATKAAEIFVGAAALGGPNFMTQQAIDRIVTRPDEAYRQRELKL